MRKFSLLTLLLSIFATFAVAQDTTDPLAEYKWITRPLVIFADSPFDPRFVLQMEMLAEDPAVLEERDVIVLTDTDVGAYGPLRQRLRPYDFTVVLLDKEGNVVLRKSTPWTPRELSRAIDKLPIRKDEIDRM
ncbi:hypothetical protein A9Q96_01630 [Rhodobacterales bacterium 52_120_T64]|nr:hypothetical protein A9Q96_01630 [Rhodobacterales bacterium 52_120_T64]